MMPRLGSVLALLCGLAACDVGGDDGGGGDDSTLPDNNNPNRYACTSGYTVTGTFAPAGARPTDVPDGCWPAGTWTFSAAIDPAYTAADITGDGVGDKCADGEMPTLAASYSLTVTRTKVQGRWDEVVTFGGNQAELNRVKISEGGGRECTLGLELFLNNDFDFVYLAPTQDFEETNLTGKGDFKRFLDKQTRFGEEN